MTESNLVKHARRELELLGEESDYIDYMVSVVEAFAAMGHSGTSAMISIGVLTELLQYKNLTSLTADPNEWYKHEGNGEKGSKFVANDNGDCWQNVRNGEAFSGDGGKTYYLLSECGPRGGKGPKHTSYVRTEE